MGKGKKKELKERSQMFKDMIARGLEKKNKAIETLNSNKKLIVQAKKQGIDTGSADKLIKKAQSILDSAEDIDDYDIALKDLENARRIVLGLQNQYNQANQLITLLNDMISDLAQKGIDTTKMQKAVMKVKNTFRERNYRAAIDMANEIVDKARQLESYFVRALDSINKASSAINEAQNVDADITTAKKFYMKAEVSRDESKYKNAIEFANESIKAAESARNERLNKFHEQTSITISELEKEISQLGALGADVSGATEGLSQLRSVFGANDVRSTFKNIDACKQLIKDTRKQHAGEKIKSVSALINDVRKEGGATDAAEQTLQQAREAFDDKKYHDVYSLTNSAIEEANKARELHEQLLGQKRQAETVLMEANAVLDKIKGFGIKGTEAGDLIARAKEAMISSDFVQGQQLGGQAVEAGAKILQAYEQAQENLQKARAAINASKNIIDITEAAETFESAKAQLNEGNYAEVSQLAIKTIRLIEVIKKENPPNLILKLPEKQTLKSGAWGRIQFEIENVGKVHANNINVQIPDKFESEGLFAIQHIKAGEVKQMNIGLRTSEIGEIPMTIGVSYFNPVTNEQYEAQDVLWINNTTADAAAGSKPTPVSPESPAGVEPEGDVKVLSELEFYQGYVRLKVGIKNDMKTVITEAKLDIEYDDNIMRLEFIEPDFQKKGNKVMFGNIQPNQKKTVAFYLDPLICTESDIDGTLNYKDIYGELRTAAMKRRRAEVVCPILYTPENINTAMLKRLINEELNIHDSKIYEIPYGLDFKRASEICKDVVQGHDLKFIREFIEHDIDDPEIETWYYGTTKVKKNKVVIKTSSRKKTNTVELFAACQDKKVLTGFLAELGHNFNDKLKQLGITRQHIFPITDDMVRQEISQTSTLLNHQFIDKTSLVISKRGSEYEITFRTSEDKSEAAELSDFIKVSPGSRNDLMDKINSVVTFLNVFTCTRGGGGEDEGKVDWEQEKSIEWEEEEETAEEVEVEKDEGSLKDTMVQGEIQNLISFGQLLYSMFLPVPIQNHLKDIKDPLILKTNDNEVPWELLHDGGDFLCLKVPVGRRLRSREIPRSNPRKEHDEIRYLFIVNATGDLDSAEEEVEYIKTHITPGIKIDTMLRGDATSASILSALRSGQYDIIHYAGHAEFNVKSPDESALISADKNRIFAQEIKRILGGKPFVFLNACSSGKEKTCEDGDSYTGSDTEGLASSFILGGALAFIGSSWPMPDISAGILASEFYNRFLGGETVGESLRQARLHLKKERPNDINWMAFTLYGDPTIRLERKKVA